MHDLLTVADRPRLRIHGEPLTIEAVEAVDVGGDGIATERRSQHVLLGWWQRSPCGTHRLVENGIEIEDAVDHRCQDIETLLERGARNGLHYLEQPDDQLL